MSELTDDWLDETICDWIERDYAAAEEACQHMDPDQLTDRQKFALAHLAGVPVHSVNDGKDGIRWETEPCAVVLEDDCWVVYTGNPNLPRMEFPRIQS